MSRFVLCLMVVFCLVFVQVGCSHDEGDDEVADQGNPDAGDQQANPGDASEKNEPKVNEPQQAELPAWAGYVGMWTGSVRAYDWQGRGWTLDAEIVINDDGVVNVLIDSSPSNVDLSRNGICGGSWQDATTWFTSDGSGGEACVMDDAIIFSTAAQATYYHYSSNYDGDWDNPQGSVAIQLNKQ